MATPVQINRSGFRPKKSPTPPQRVLDRAEDWIRWIIQHQDATRVRAVLRPSVYIGPASAGDRGAYTLELWWHNGDRPGHDLKIIEPDGQSY
jgi:hypothetical protein